MSEENNVFRPKHMTLADIREGCITLTNNDNDETRICVLNEELRQGIDAMQELPKSVTIFGSARTPEIDPYYQKIVRISRRASEAGFAVVTGGGPGMMEAGNRGAFDAGGTSVGMTIKLPFEQETSPYVNLEIPFYYFFTRKVSMTYSAEAYIYAPGGFGTLDELFEVLTLIQTKKIPASPVVLVGKAFWEPLQAFIDQILLKEFATISPEDVNLYTITDDEDEVIEIIKNAPLREM